MSHGAVFVHFSTREELLLEVATAFARELTDRMYAMVAAEAPLLEVLEAHVDAVAEREDLYREIMLDAPRMSSEFVARWTGIQSAVARYLSEAVARESRRGRLKPLAPHLLFHTWIGMIHHALAWRGQFGRPFAEHGRELAQHLMYLVGETGMEGTQ